jgi:hypothetical protein
MRERQLKPIAGRRTLSAWLLDLFAHVARTTLASNRQTHMLSR